MTEREERYPVVLQILERLMREFCKKNGLKQPESLLVPANEKATE